MVALDQRLIEGKGVPLGVSVGGAGEVTVCRPHPARSAAQGLAIATEPVPSVVRSPPTVSWQTAATMTPQASSTGSLREP